MQTRNPYVLDRTPRRSSSGTGAAIAASLAAVGVGTETDGSIVCPSAAAALVGIKPTIGLVSQKGIVPISHTQDTPGPMARTVADAAALLSVLSDRGTDYARSLDASALKGARIGVVRGKPAGVSPAADRVFESALRAMKEQGAVLVDADLPHLGEYDDPELEVLLTELKADLAKYLAEYAPSAPFKDLAGLIAWNRDRHAAIAVQGDSRGRQHRAEALRAHYNVVTMTTWRTTFGSSGTLSKTGRTSASMACHSTKPGRRSWMSAAA